MAARTFVSSTQPVEKLQGRENYHDWLVAMQAFLEVEDLWETIQAPQGGALSTDAKKISKARGKLVLSVDPVVYHRIRNQTSAKAVWDKLKSVYDDKGLTER